MKAKTMLGLIACASACVSLSAFANTTNGWFGVTVANETVNPVGVAVNSVGTVANSKISLTDVEQSSALAFTPESGSITNCTDDIYVIGANVVLTPCSTNDFTDVDCTSAKAGIVAGIDDLGATNYYGFANSQWYKLTGATVAEPGNETAFFIVLNYRDNKAHFIIREASEDKWFGPYDMSDSGASTLVDIKVWGTGSISSVTGAFEVAVAAYGDNKYGSVAEASSAARTASPEVDPGSLVRVVNEDGTTEAENAKAQNGLSEIVCKALGLPIDDESANIAVAPAETDTAADKITLSVALPAGAEPGAVKFVVSDGTTTTDYENASAIAIPLKPGTYTITPALR